MREGRLYRSDRVGAEARVGLQALGIDAVIDLRTREERSSDPRLLAESLSVPLFDVIPIGWSRPVDFSPAAIASRYAEMAEAGRPALRVIATILQSRTAVIIHCAAGRDRTGIVIASILAAVGVDPDAIAGDYAKSSGRCDDDVPAYAETMRIFLNAHVPCAELAALEDLLVEGPSSRTG